jgi:hypothetical protein
MHLCTCVSEEGGDEECSENRGRQRLSGCIARTDAPVYMRERGGGRRGNCMLSNDISAVMHTQIRQFHSLMVEKRRCVFIVVYY